MGKKKKKEIKKIAKFSQIIWGISIVLLVILGYFIHEANVLPAKYFFAITIMFAIFLSIHGILVLKKKTRTWVLVILNVLAILFMCGETFAIFKINDMITFLKENLNAHYETNVYNIIVNKESNYETLEDIKNQTIKTVKDMEDISLFEKSVKEKLNGNIEYEENISELLTKVTEEKEMVLIVNSGNYDAMIDVDKEYESKVKIIDTITIKIELENTNTGLNVTKDPFVIYLSGIDTRSSYLPSRSLSDVNIVLAINPKTKHILMIHIPRDYYVQIHGTTGLKDKLTHAGTIGGVELSMSTIEDLLEIDLPYYVRVNFNAVVNLVDAIGGININSDVDYSFRCWTDHGCTFHPGLNSVGGRCALAFARERYAYQTGDRHRGENQEQVLELVINKITSSSTLISNYNEILNALSGTFQTNLTMEEITSLVKMQINDMSGWKMESVNVDGTGAYKPTHSYPNQNLYVMDPKMETVEKAINKLNEVLETP